MSIMNDNTHEEWEKAARAAWEEQKRLEAICRERYAEISRLQAQVTELQKTYSNEVERRHKAEAEASRLKEGIKEALRTAAYRWCEWGERAQSTGKILNGLLESSEESKVDNDP